jgi:hypothetical protein
MEWLAQELCHNYFSRVYRKELIVVYSGYFLHHFSQPQQSLALAYSALFSVNSRTGFCLPVIKGEGDQAHSREKTPSATAGEINSGLFRS